jgi:SMI1-KNR4 cell-wall
MKSDFWSEIITSLYTSESLTDEMIDKAEAELGVKLPVAYIALLRTQNGGYINFEGYPAPPDSGQTLIMVDHIMGIGAEMDILDSKWLCIEWHMPEQLVLLSGDGHWWVALDYRECGTSDEPPIVYIDNESATPVNPDKDYSEWQIAPDFATFLKGLIPTEET